MEGIAKAMAKDSIQDMVKVILHLRAMGVIPNPHITQTNRLCTVANPQCMEIQIQCTIVLLKVTTRMVIPMETRMEIHIKRDITHTVDQIRIENFDELFIDKYIKNR
jgi:tRNA(Phe) wybutosine-synthesizing methylase Tyw3